MILMPSLSVDLICLYYLNLLIADCPGLGVGAAVKLPAIAGRGNVIISMFKITLFLSIYHLYLQVLITHVPAF